MDDILAKASSQAMSFAIRSGISLASGFAIKTVARFLDKIPPAEKKRIEAANARLHQKTKIVATAIDLVRLEAARGHSALEATVDLVADLSDQIARFDENIVRLVDAMNNSNQKATIVQVERAIGELLAEINDAIPLLNLSLVACGANLEAARAPRFSPGRLLQAAAHLEACDRHFDGARDVAAGPAFDLTMYTVFYRAKSAENAKETKMETKQLETKMETKSSPNSESVGLTWKEEYARASVRLVRRRGDARAYEIVAAEDFDDGRYHEDEPARQRNIAVAHIRRQFFSASGRLLRLEGSNSPVLIFKVAAAAGAPPEYIAFGEARFDSDSDSDSDSSDYEDAHDTVRAERSTTLSLLQYLVRLAALQENEQMSVLDITDEKLALYLHDETDGSFYPKTSAERASAAAAGRAQNSALQLDSNIARLKNLSLGRD
ncbi:putative Ran-specific GTPase-activating protein [Clavispora lusitaniae]|uniref:Ran-specific GTPase-activating protein n=1 Tax=Clavispora lusitaniae TaxID=36911 RepID=A0AA91T4J9_CLALS|nr:putative Ran-specific GTPase-activating protein [Clavispora lusitaniae]